MAPPGPSFTVAMQWPTVGEEQQVSPTRQLTSEQGKLDGSEPGALAEATTLAAGPADVELIAATGVEAGGVTPTSTSSLGRGGSTVVEQPRPSANGRETASRAARDT